MKIVDGKRWLKRSIRWYGRKTKWARGKRVFFFSRTTCHVTRMVTELGPVSRGASATQQLGGGAFEKHRDVSETQVLKLLASILPCQRGLLVHNLPCHHGSKIISHVSQSAAADASSFTHSIIIYDFALTSTSPDSGAFGTCCQAYSDLVHTPLCQRSSTSPGRYTPYEHERRA